MDVESLAYVITNESGGQTGNNIKMTIVKSQINFELRFFHFATKVHIPVFIVVVVLSSFKVI